MAVTITLYIFMQARYLVNGRYHKEHSKVNYNFKHRKEEMGRTFSVSRIHMEIQSHTYKIGFPLGFRGKYFC